MVNHYFTDFYVGLRWAVEILGGSSAYQKRIIFVGDFGEGGFKYGNLDREHEVADFVYELAESARVGGIAIE